MTATLELPADQRLHCDSCQWQGVGALADRHFTLTGHNTFTVVG